MRKIVVVWCWLGLEDRHVDGECALGRQFRLVTAWRCCQEELEDVVFRAASRETHSVVYWVAMLVDAPLAEVLVEFEVSGEVSIVYIAFAPILVPCICAYMELNPKVNVRLLHFNHLLNSSGEVDYDFILTASRYAPDLGEGERLWVTQPLFAEDAYFIISPRHPLFDRLPEDDADYDWYFLRYP